MNIDVREARGELRRTGFSFRRRQHELVNESALNAAEYAFEHTRQAHKEDIEAALSRSVTMPGGEVMTRAEAIVLKRKPGISPAERRAQAIRLKRARVRAIGFVRSGFAWAMRDLNKVAAKPRRPKGVRMVPPAKGYAIPAKAGGEPKATIVNAVRLRGPKAAEVDADRERQLAIGIARETRTLPRRIEGFLVRLFTRWK